MAICTKCKKSCETYKESLTSVDDMADLLKLMSERVSKSLCQK